MDELIEEIIRLKKEKNAIILAHNYQRPEIYKVADFIGDSLALSIEASKSDADIIVFCGADFMAEAAKILSPEKKVLLPHAGAKCPMAAMISPQEVKDMKKLYPGAPVVCYINTIAEVKAECDIICTSRNAIEIVNNLDEDEVIFIPDQHLGNYVQKHTNKKLHLSKGYCFVHAYIWKEFIEGEKEKYPNAKVMAHPECPEEILKLADKVTGTGGMIKYAKESEAEEFIVITEIGMSERLKLEVPNKTFYPAGGLCTTQKFITLPVVKEALEKEQYEITLPEEIRIKAKIALDKMINS